jgi:glycosyltransferase involved in cell wall biosynthesis
MPPHSPLISVIIPVYNGEAYLAEAVHSILAQGYEPLEIIVVDDGSTDGSAAIAHAFGQKIQYVYQANQGPAAARNRGLELAQGSVIGFLDADDLWPEGKLSKQLALWQEEPVRAMVMGYVQLLTSTQESSGRLLFQPSAAPYLSPQVGAMLCKRTLFDEIGSFDTSMRYGEDLDWFMRVREQDVQIGISQEVCLLYRLHSNNITRGKSTAQRNIMAAFKRSLERRRAQSNQTIPTLPPLITVTTQDMDRNAA